MVKNSNSHRIMISQGRRILQKYTRTLEAVLPLVFNVDQLLVSHGRLLQPYLVV